MAEWSEAYEKALEESRAHHASSKTFSGLFLRPHKPYIASIIDRTGAKTVLDYGAGKGLQYDWIDPADGKTLEQAWGVRVTKYDPAWPPFAAEPTGRFDLVLCTHVLGSIPLADQSQALGRIWASARRAVYISEKLGPVKKNVLSSRELFPFDWSPEQWLAHLAPFAAAGADLGIEAHATMRIRPTPNFSLLTRYRWDPWLELGPGAQAGGGAWRLLDQEEAS